MNQHDFETRILHLWMTTRVPLSRANVQFFTRAPRKKIDRWLDEMVREGVLDVDSDDAGELVWAVRGAERPAQGAERVEDIVKMEQLSREARGRRSRVQDALARVGARGIVEQSLARAGGEKSVVAAGALSLLGPLGWLYAGPAREVAPAAILYYVLLPILWWIPLVGPLLHTLMLPLLLPLSVIIGVLYAWQYNKNGQVTPLLTDDDKPRLPGRR